MLFQNCADLIKFFKNLIFSTDFLKRHRQTSKNFIRQRKLPFSTLLLFLINLIKGSYQDELDHFFKLTFRTPLNTYLVNFLDHFMAQQNFQEKHPELLSIHAAPVLKGGQAVCPCYFLQQEQKQIL